MGMKWLFYQKLLENITELIIGVVIELESCATLIWETYEDFCQIENNQFGTNFQIMCKLV